MSAVENVDEYLQTLTLSKRSKASYRSSLLAFLKWCRKGSFYTVGTAAKYYEASLLKEGKIKEATVTVYARRVRNFCAWLSDNRKSEIFDMFAACFDGQGIAAPPVKINDSDIVHLCKVAAKKGESGLRSRAMFLLASTCGFTPAQISRIMPEDVTVTERYTWVCTEDEEAGVPFEVPITPRAERAIVDYLDRRGVIDDGLPLLAVTTAKAGRTPMSSAEVKKSIVGMLEVLGYEYLDVFHGDSQRTVASLMGRMDGYSRRRMAETAMRLYYEGLDIERGQACAE